MSLKAFPLVEPLESRIAPAAIINTGVPGDPSNHAYSDLPFHATTVGGAHFDATDPTGANFVGGTHTYYIELTKGDVLRNFSTGAATDLIRVKTGTVVAFFVDKNANNQVDLNELTGMSLGKGADLSVGGTVDGDIVDNFNDATGKIDATGALLTAKLQTIKRLSVDDVTRTNGTGAGAIVAGGAISNIGGKTVNRVLAGSAGNGYAYDFNGDETGGHNGDPGGGAVLAFTSVAKQTGASITTVSLTATTRIQAGDGGGSANGGVVSKISLKSDLNGFDIHSGNGGAGSAGSVKGGNGGTISTVLVSGPDATGGGDTTDNDTVNIVAGKGGAAATGGKAGSGGLIQHLFFGFDTQTKLSTTSVRDNVFVQGGDGADGKIAGAGGKLLDIHIHTTTPNSGSPGNELRVIAGNGGQNSGGVGGKDGAGGSITTLEVRNSLEAGDDTLTTSSANAAILVQAGNAGIPTAPALSNSDGFGAAGGNITGVKALGFQVTVAGGDGSAGDQKGGAGGKLNTVLLEGGANNDIHTNTAVINAGQGQNSTGGKGGAGGSINSLTINSADFASLGINTGTKANGGSSGLGKGGSGGLVNGLQINDIAFSTAANPTGHAGNATLRSGTGGNGASGGGVGGKFSSASLVADNLNINLVTGNGGAATTTGKGGVGGGISSVALVTGGQVSAANVVVSATSGTGGAGMLTGKGGAGGNVLSTNLTTGRVTEQGVLPGGAVTLTGGAGGNGGATGASGAGAAISTVNGTSTDASVSILAGNAGLTGAKAGKGGGITGVRASAQTDTTVHAGNGSNGGAGGNLQTIGFTGPLFGAPTGNIALIAGNGSGAGMKAGAGGNVSNASGFVSTGSGTTTQIRAGNGGSVATKAAAGGSVLNINILNDLDPAGAGSGSVFTIDAGDATAAASAAKGGVGGSVKGVFVSHLDAATVFQHIAAGNGGDTSLANGIGGVGGSVQNVNVDHDIGNISDGVTPSGQAFGYTTMGGIFAGSGGINTTVAHTATTLDSHDGKAGNVTNIAAQAIASIVAGRPVTGTVITARNLVTTVDEITLIAKDVDAGVQLARVDSNGKYTNYVIANLVGAVVNPNQAGVAYPTAHPHANTFDTGEYNDLNADVTFSLGDSANASTDGFIGALNLTANKNFVPEAFLTLDPSGNSLFIDYTNGKATP